MIATRYKGILITGKTAKDIVKAIIQLKDK